MSILFSQVVKKTTIYFAVIAFFALFLSQTTFAAPTVTFDSPTKEVDIEFAVDNVTSNVFRVEASFADTSAGVADVVSSNVFASPVTLTLSEGEWNIIVHELAFPGFAIVSSSAPQTLVISLTLEVTLEVEIQDENGNVITNDAVSGASIKPGYDVYVTYKADGPKIETSATGLAFSADNLYAMFYYDKDQLTFEHYQRANGTDNALDTIIPKNTGGATDLFQEVDGLTTFSHFYYALPRDTTTATDERTTENDAYWDNTGGPLIGKEDFLVYGPAYDTEDTTKGSYCGDQYMFLPLADFPTLAAAGNGDGRDLADFDCVGYKWQRGNIGDAAGATFPGTGEVFSGDDTAVLGKIKFSVPTTANEGDFNIITAGLYTAPTQGGATTIVSPTSYHENIFTLSVDKTAPAVTETVLVDTTTPKTGKFDVKVTFGEEVENVDINDFRFVETGTDTVSGTISEVKAYDSSDVLQGETTDTTTVDGEYFVVSVIPSAQIKTGTSATSYSFEVIESSASRIADGVGNTFVPSTDSNPLDKLTVSVDTSFSFTNISIETALVTLNGKERTNSSSITLQFDILSSSTPAKEDFTVALTSGSSITDSCSNISFATNPVNTSGNTYTLEMTISNNDEKNLEYDCSITYTDSSSNTGSLAIPLFVVDKVFQTLEFKTGLTLNDVYDTSIADGYLNYAEIVAGGSNSIIKGLNTFIETLSDTTVPATDTTTLEGNIKYGFALGDFTPTSFDGTPPTFTNFSTINSGQYSVWVQAEDELGNKVVKRIQSAGGTTLKFILDRTAPGTPIVSSTALVEGNTTDGTRYINKAVRTGTPADLIVAGSGSNTIKYALTNQNTDCDSLTTYVTDKIQTNDARLGTNGNYRICIEASDQAGNTSYLAQNFIADSTEPHPGVTLESTLDVFKRVNSLFYLNKKTRDGASKAIGVVYETGFTYYNIKYALVTNTVSCSDVTSFGVDVINTKNAAFTDKTSHRICAQVEDAAGNVGQSLMTDFITNYTLPTFDVLRITGHTNDQFFVYTDESNVTLKAEVTGISDDGNAGNSCGTNQALTFPTSLTKNAITNLIGTGTGANAKWTCFKAINKYDNESTFASNQAIAAVSNLVIRDFNNNDNIADGDTVDNVRYTNALYLEFDAIGKPSSEVSLYLTDSNTAPDTSLATLYEAQTADAITGILDFTTSAFARKTHYVWATVKPSATSSIVSSPFLVLQLVVDTINPTLTINDISTDNILNRAEKGGDLVISGTSDAEDNQVVSVSFNNNAVEKDTTVTSGAWSITFTSTEQASATPDGVVPISVYVTDRASNENSLIKEITYDTADPSLLLIKTGDGDYLTIVGSDVTEVRYATTSTSLTSANTNCTNKTYTTVGTGVTGQSTNQVCFRSQDAAGNFTYMNTKDALEGISSIRLQTGTIGSVKSGKVYTRSLTPAFIAGTLENTEAKLELRETDGSTVVGSAVEVTSNNNGVLSFNFGTLTAGEYKIYGGIKPSGASDYTTLVFISDISVDTTLPAITVNNISTDNIVNKAEKASSLTISGTTDVEAHQDISVIINIAAGNQISKSTTASSAGTWSVSLTAAEQQAIPEGTIGIISSTTDFAGNNASSDLREIRYDTIPPTLLLVKTGSGSYIAVGGSDTTETRYATTTTSLSGTDVDCSSGHTYNNVEDTITGQSTNQVCFRVQDVAGNFEYETTKNAIEGLANTALSTNTTGTVKDREIYTNDLTPAFVATTLANTPSRVQLRQADGSTVVGSAVDVTADASGNVSFGFGTLTEGEYKIYGAIQPAGASDYTVFVHMADLSVDTTAPTIGFSGVLYIDDIVNAWEKTNSTVIQGSSNVEVGQTVTLDFGGAFTTTGTQATSTAWQVSVSGSQMATVLEDGTVTLTATVTDLAGNTSSTTRDIVFDTIAPTLIMVKTGPSAWIAVGDATTTQIRRKITTAAHTAAAADCTGLTYNVVSSVVDYTTQFQVCFRAQDVAGNFAYETTKNAVDGLANLVLATGTSGTLKDGKIYTNAVTPAFTATTIPSTRAKLELRETNGTTILETREVTSTDTGVLSFNFGTLAEGEYKIYGAIQPAGASDYTTLTSIVDLAVDTTDPTLTFLNTGFLFDNIVNKADKAAALEIQVNTDAEADNAVTVDVGGVASVTGAAGTGIYVDPTTTRWYLNVSTSQIANIQDGTVTLTATVSDLAGNTVSTTRDIVFDTTPPALTIVRTGSGAYSIAAGDATTTETKYRITASLLTATAADCASLSYSADGNTYTSDTALEYQTCFRVQDAAGNFAYETTKNAIEGLGGVTTATGTTGTVSGGKTYTSSTSPSFTSVTVPTTPARIELRDASDNVISTAEVTSDANGAVNFDFGSIQEGEYSLYGAIQPAGSTDYTTLVLVLQLVIDTTAPTLTLYRISVDNIVNEAEKRSNLQIGGVSNAENGQTVTINIGGEFSGSGTLSTLESYSFTALPSQMANIADGTYTVTATVSDLAGNSVTTTRDIVFDTEGPTITIAPNTQDRGTSITYTASVTDSSTGVAETRYQNHHQNLQTSCGGVPWTDAKSTTTPVTFSDEADNGQNVCVRSTDNAGNHSYKALSIANIDTTAPDSFAFEGDDPLLSSVKVGNDLDSFDVTISNIEDDEDVSIEASSCGNTDFRVTGGTGDTTSRTYSVEGRPSSKGIFDSCELTFFDEAGNASTTTLTIDFAATSSSSGGVFGGGGGSTAPVAFAPSNPLSPNYQAPQAPQVEYSNQQFPSTGVNQGVSSGRSTQQIESNLRKGDRGDDVKNLQKYLNEQGFTVSQTGAGSPGQESSYFGPATEKALKAYQEHHKSDILEPLGLTSATGYAGSSTINHINDRIAQQTDVVETPSTSTRVTTASSSLKRSLKKGDRGDDVKDLQKYLNEQGFTVSQTGAGSPGQESSYFGPATEKALKAYQEHHKSDILEPLGLTSATGYAGSSTINHINDRIAPQLDTNQLLNQLIEILKSRGVNTDSLFNSVPQSQGVPSPTFRQTVPTPTSQSELQAPSQFGGEETQEPERQTGLQYVAPSTGSFVAPISNSFSDVLTDGVQLQAPSNPFGF